MRLEVSSSLGKLRNNIDNKYDNIKHAWGVPFASFLAADLSGAYSALPSRRYECDRYADLRCLEHPLEFCPNMPQSFYNPSTCISIYCISTCCISTYCTSMYFLQFSPHGKNVSPFPVVLWVVHVLCIWHAFTFAKGSIFHSGHGARKVGKLSRYLLLLKPSSKLTTAGTTKIRAKMD